MKKIFATLVALTFLASAANAETYKFDPNHTTVNWSANHFGFSNPTGKFTEFEGALNLDEKNPQKSSLDVIIKIDSLNTGLSKFDKHLKSADFSPQAVIIDGRNILNPANFRPKQLFTIGIGWNK